MNRLFRAALAKRFPFSGLAFSLALCSWLVMLVGSAIESYKVEQTFHYVELSYPLFQSQAVYHHIGFWLAITALVSGVAAFHLDQKALLPKVSIFLSITYALLHIIP